VRAVWLRGVGVPVCVDVVVRFGCWSFVFVVVVGCCVLGYCFCVVCDFVCVGGVVVLVLGVCVGVLC